MSEVYPVEVHQVVGRAAERAFLGLPAALGGEAAGWSVPLEFDTRRFFNPGFNGFLATHEVARFLAWRQGRVVGRIATALRRDGGGGNPAGAGPTLGSPTLGSFGFLALEQDATVLAALLAAAAAWLRARGASRWRGPMNLSINHEVGAQLSGFERPGMVRMPRTPPWLPAMLDAAKVEAGQVASTRVAGAEGAPARLVREKLVISRTLDLAGETHSARFARLLARWPGRGQLRLRPLDPRDYAREIALVAALFNDAWAENWGAEPVGPAEARTIARIMRPLLRAGGILFAEWQGRPIGVISVIPNLDEATEGLGGKLLPWGWWRVARLLLGGPCRTGRAPMLGIAREFRGHPASAMAMGLLFQGAIQVAKARGWQQLDMGWMLEDNHHVLAFTGRMGAPESGRWGIWGGTLPGDTARAAPRRTASGS